MGDKADRWFHRTRAENVQPILKDGFKDATGYYLTTEECTGVWISDVPLDANEGAKGNALLLIEIAEETISVYEWVEEDKPYREFCVPAKLLNEHGKVRVCTDEDEEDVDRRFGRRSHG